MRSLPFRALITSTHLCVLRRPSLSSQLHFHTDEPRAKYQTDTELVHQGVMYGRSAYPSRPNDPRVPSNPKFGITHLTNERLTSKPNSEDSFSKQTRKDFISKAMKVYLEKAKKYGEFMCVQQEEFDSGRRHLANMMGVKHEAAMTQSDINAAIRYLMPSVLFDHRAKPRMRPPEEIYPAIKDAQFLPSGRPLHSMFYTGKANFYQACFEVENEMTRLNEYQDALGIVNTPLDAKINLTGSCTWLSPLEMKQLFLEKIDLKRYESFIGALQRLAEHPYSKLCEEFILRFRKQLKSAAEMIEILPLKYDENGRPYMNAVGEFTLLSIIDLINFY